MYNAVAHDSSHGHPGLGAQGRVVATPATPEHPDLGAPVVVATLPFALFGSPLTTPHTFSNGTVADADDVNANFVAVAASVNDNDGRLDDLETAVDVAGATTTMPANQLSLGDGGTDLIRLGSSSLLMKSDASTCHSATNGDMVLVNQNVAAGLRFNVQDCSTAAYIDSTGDMALGSADPQGVRLNVVGTTTGIGDGMNVNYHIVRSGLHISDGNWSRLIRLPTSNGVLRIVAREQPGANYTTAEYRVMNAGWNDPSHVTFTELALDTRGGGAADYDIRYGDGGAGSMDLEVDASAGAKIFWSFSGVAESPEHTREGQ